MNRAMFYSLIESSMLLRDYTTLLEADSVKKSDAEYAKDWASGVGVGKPTAEQVAKNKADAITRRQNAGPRVGARLRKLKMDVTRKATEYGGTVAKHLDELTKHGSLGTVAKMGAVAAPAFVAGSLHGAHRTKQYVDKLPAVKAAKEWGPWISKAKKYGPYAAAAGGGLMLANALSNND